MNPSRVKLVRPKPLTNMASLESLHARTTAFLDLHWPEGEPRPEWSAPWTFVGTIPNQERQGVYALVHGEDVVYIGVGAGENPGRYEGAGLGNRLHNYWRRDSTDPRTADGESRYVPSDVWGEVTETPAIVTIGFTPDRASLANGLEAYLIRELKPERNVLGK